MVQEQPGCCNSTKYEQFIWAGLELNCVDHKFLSLVLGSMPDERNDALNSSFSLQCPLGCILARKSCTILQLPELSST